MDLKVTSNKFEDALRAAIEDHVRKAVAEAVEQAKKDLDAKIPELTASIGVTLQRAFSATDNEAIIQIRLRHNLR